MLLLVPYFAHEYFLHIIISILLYIILTLSLNLVSGYAGQLSLGHAAFYGIGAYTTALLLLRLKWSFWLALPMSGVVTATFGVLLGLPSLRLQGDYLGIVTLGFGEIVRLVLINWVSLTRGPMGLPGIPSPEIGSFVFFSKTPFYYLVLTLAVLTYLTLNRLATSGFGLSLITVREDEVVAEAVGIDTTRVKLLAFSLSAFYAGVAGSFFASYISFVSPDTFKFMDSVTILAMVVLGGMASLPGSLLGAAVLAAAPEVLRFMSDYRMILYGVLMVVMMIYKPTGFWGADKRVRNAIKQVVRGDLS
ncbi:MAG: branched-chain amino acid ABC transporter permease [Actinobacteria bacterium]|nr:branched-chain amino acid ABC transporter permease [Actinomycetota bacterium]